jgi:hypothetical protein
MKLEILVTIEHEWNTLARRVVVFDNLESGEAAYFAEAAGKATEMMVHKVAAAAHRAHLSNQATDEKSEADE